MPHTPRRASRRWPSSPLAIHDRGRSLDGADAERGTLLERAAAVSGATLQRTVDGLTDHDVEQAVRLLTSPRGQVRLVGGRFSGLLARFLAQHRQLTRSGNTGACITPHQAWHCSGTGRS